MKRRRFRTDPGLPPPITAINAVGLLAAVVGLLVSFMLWTSRHEPGPDLPAAMNAPIQPDPSWGALFTMTAAGDVYVDHEPVVPLSEKELDERLRVACQPRMRFIGSEHALYIEADPRLSYASVLEVLERCRMHGGDRAVFLTKRNITVLDVWASGNTPSPSEWRRAREEQRPSFLH